MSTSRRKDLFEVIPKNEECLVVKFYTRMDRLLAELTIFVLDTRKFVQDLEALHDETFDGARLYSIPWHIIVTRNRKVVRGGAPMFVTRIKSINPSWTDVAGNTNLDELLKFAQKLRVYLPNQIREERLAELFARLAKEQTS